MSYISLNPMKPLSCEGLSSPHTITREVICLSLFSKIFLQWQAFKPHTFTKNAISFPYSVISLQYGLPSPTPLIKGHEPPSTTIKGFIPLQPLKVCLSMDVDIGFPQPLKIFSKYKAHPPSVPLDILEIFLSIDVNMSLSSPPLKILSKYRHQHRFSSTF